jgi:hypothetical protein
LSKAGDYVVSYEIEEEMEKDRKIWNEKFIDNQLDYEFKRQANLYNMILDKQDEVE